MMEQEELNKILEEHEKWLSSEGKQGKKAILSGLNLEGAYLEGANLRHANLASANLRDADLIRSNLEYANLEGANLENTCLWDASFGGTNLSGTNLSGANLEGAYFKDTDLRRANLEGAYLESDLENIQQETQDPVNHPEHYTSGGIETIDVIRAKLSKDEFKGFLKGNVIKYVTRAGLKNDEKEDLKKAKWYLNRLLDLVE